MPTGQSSFSANDGTTYFDLTTDTGDRAEINGALFFQNKSDSSSGTGLIQAIVRVQDGNDDTPGFENGYNTSARPLSYEENTSPSFTTSLLLSAVPVVTIDGVQYYEFRLDINQVGGDLSKLSLDEIKLYKSAVGDGEAEGTIDGTWFTDNAQMVYDMDGAGDASILLDASLSSGSGSSDMFFYVAVTDFGAVDPDDTYVTLYSEFGAAGTLDAGDGLTPLNDPANTALDDNGDDTGDVATAVFGTYTANDGFEEWSVSKQTGGVISGYKWEDSNGNGLWDSGETGLSGWNIDYTITYTEGHGHNFQNVTITGTATTDGTGFYSILVPASADKNETYTITLTEGGQAGFVNTFDGDGTANSTTTFNFSSNNLTLTGTPASPDISGHLGVTETMNFGNFETFTISGHKYTDITGDGLSNDDTGLGGVTVFIDVDGDGLNNDGFSTVTADGTTDANDDGVIDAADAGYWELTGLDATVAGAEVKEITPSGYIQTVGQVGTVTDTSGTYLITGTSGTDQSGLDFANFETFTISGHKYTDVTGDGLSNDDTGLGGVTVFVDVDGDGLNNDGYSTVTADGTTDANDDGVIDAADVGYWELTGLDAAVAGAEVKEITPSGYVQTVGQVGTVTDTSGTYLITGTSGTDQSGLDFANFETFTISGHKYTDITGDGLSNDDTGLGGVTVFIDVDGDGLNNDGFSTVTADGTTDANDDGVIDAADAGYWELTGLDATVAGAEVKEITPSGYIQTVGQVGTVTDTSGTYLITGTSGTDQTGLDFANFLPDPSIDVEKSVKTNLFDFLPEDGDDDPNGLLAGTSTVVTFKVVVTNDGNESLSDITMTDSVVHTVNGVPTPQTIVYTPDGDAGTLDAFDVFVDLNHDGIQQAGTEAWSLFDTDGDGTIDAGAISTLAPGDSFTLYYSLDSLLGQHENTSHVEAVSAISDTTVSDSDDANYYVVEEDCVGVRTPGFWANSKWGLFWNLNANNPGNTGTDQDALPQAGEPNFPGGELLYGIDTSKDGFVNVVAGDSINDDKPLDSNASGLLIGDYNKNGITDVGEDTIFISLSDAKALINASNKNIGDGKTADGIWMLGRDVVATWLNYLANNPDDDTGNCVGIAASGDGTNTPREFLDAAIDWLQQFASDQNTGNANNIASNTFHDGDTQAKFQFDGRIAPSSGAWQNPFLPGEDIPVSAAAMHAALDGYNNTGTINGVEYCCDADSELALNILSQIQQVSLV